MAYDAFISYSHAGDGLLAPRLQQALGRFAKPWWRRRALRVFRDETALSVNPGLWSSITDALDQTEWFVLLASPDAVQSEWVNREVEYWCANHDPRRVLPVLTDGVWIWDESKGDFDWAACTAVPLALRGVFSEEPRHIDMCWARTEEQLDLHDGRFRDQVAELAAPMHGVAKDEIAGDDVREHRRTLRIAWGGIVLLLLLLAASIAGAAQAVQAADEARRSEQAAIDSRVEADRQAALALASADEAERRQEEADQSAAEADRQRAQASSSATDAQRERAEAERQRAEADRNAATAEAQRRLADQASNDLAATVDQLTETNAELDEANDDLVTTNSALDDANRDLATTNAQLDDANTNLQSTNEQLGAANDTLTAQAANLDAGRLAVLGTERTGSRLDLALLLAAEAEARAATDWQLPTATLFQILQVDGRGLERVLTFARDNVPNQESLVAVSPGDEWIAVVHDAGLGAAISIWPGDAASGATPRVVHIANFITIDATFDADGRHLIITTQAPTFVLPGVPPEPPMFGVEIIEIETGELVLSLAPSVDGRVVLSNDASRAAIQMCLPAGAVDCEHAILMFDSHLGLVSERPGILPSVLGARGATSTTARTNSDLSPDGRHLLTFAPPGEFQVWSFERPRTTVSLYTPAAGTFAIPSFDSDGSLIVGARGDEQIEFFDPNDGTVVQIRSVPGATGIRGFASLDGATTVAVLEVGKLTMLSTSTSEVVEVSPCATDVSASPQGRWMIVGGENCATTDLVATATNRHVGPLAGHNTAVARSDMSEEDVAYQYEAGDATTGEAATFGVFDLAANRWIELRRDLTPGTRPSFSRSFETVVASIGTPGSLRVWSATSSGQIVGGGAGRISFFGSVPKVAVANSTGSVTVWDLTFVGRARPVGTIPHPPSSFAPRHAVSPRGDMVAWESPSTSTIEITSIATGENLASISYVARFLVDLEFSPNGSELLIADVPGDTLRYDVRQRQLLTPLPGFLVSLSADGRYATTSVNFQDLLVFDLATNEELARFRTPDSVFPGDAVVSPDGSVVVIHDQVFDTRTRQLRATLASGFDSFFDALHFAPSGDRLYHLDRSPDGTVTLDMIDATTFERFARRQLRDEAGGFWSPAMQVSPDGAHLWVGGELLDAETLTVLGRPGDLVTREPGPDDVTFSSTGDALYITSGARIHRFVTSPSALAAQACELVGRNLTAAERDLFGVGDTVATCPQWPS